MNDDTRKKLNTILATYDENLAEVARANAANLAAAVAFPERYATLRSSTIRPAMEEFAELLNGRGHEVTISELEESTSLEAAVTSAAISLRVVPKAFAHKGSSFSKNFIELLFSANRLERKITVSSSNTIINSAGSVGKRAQYEIAEVTPQVIEAHVLNVLGEALSAK